MMLVFLMHALVCIKLMSDISDYAYKIHKI